MTAPVDLPGWVERRRPAREPLVFRLDGVEYSVPERTARTWVCGLLSDEPYDVLLDVLTDDDAADLFDDADDPDSPITTDLLTEVGRKLIGQVAGRPWWQVSTLTGVLVREWPTLDGRAADRGLGDPLDWPLERLCNWIYAWWIEHPGQFGREGVDQLLSRPPESVALAGGDGEDPEEWGEDEASGWMELAGIQAAGTLASAGRA